MEALFNRYYYGRLAGIDRLSFHAHIIQLTGESYRENSELKEQKKNGGKWSRCLERIGEGLNCE